ncbi:MAG: hypothetical protein GTN71_09380 [Anaerolineae bacterium]|nr:hypothetical protein [Anaerolineae bacterium]
MIASTVTFPTPIIEMLLLVTLVDLAGQFIRTCLLDIADGAGGPHSGAWEVGCYAL